MILKLTAVQATTRDENTIYIDANEIVAWHASELHNRIRIAIQLRYGLAYFVTQEEKTVTAMILEARSPEKVLEAPAGQLPVAGKVSLH